MSDHFGTLCIKGLKVNEDGIPYIIKSLNSNKSHGWDKLSIKLFKKFAIKL